MNFIDELTPDQILNGVLPINELLENSLYYPSCGFDGGVVKFCGKEIQSFIYCDYATGKIELLNQLNSFKGYDILANRSLVINELIPNGWNSQLPPNFNIDTYYRYRDEFKKPFANWVVYERKSDFDETHGPMRFSLIYIGGEGVATYQALYWSNKKTAKALAIIQPGHGFGFNWTNFSELAGPLKWVISNNPHGCPDFILYGGFGSDYTDLNWGGYELEKTITPYYTSLNNLGGSVTIWRKVVSTAKK